MKYGQKLILFQSECVIKTRIGGAQPTPYLGVGRPQAMALMGDAMMRYIMPFRPLTQLGFDLGASKLKKCLAILANYYQFFSKVFKGI